MRRAAGQQADAGQAADALLAVPPWVSPPHLEYATLTKWTTDQNPWSPHHIDQSRSHGGATVFTGTRIPLDALFRFIVDGATLDEFLTSYPDITREQAITVLSLAHRALAASPGMDSLEAAE